jgi:hypothetical protein
MSSRPGPPVGLIETRLEDLEIAFLEREEEAAAIVSFSSTALALRMYALEIRVKIVICKHLRIQWLPKACKTHDLSELIVFTGLLDELDDPANVDIRENWYLLVEFSKKRLNDLRYLARADLKIADSSSLMAALDDPMTGVIAWLVRPR